MEAERLPIVASIDWIPLFSGYVSESKLQLILPSIIDIIRFINCPSLIITGDIDA